MMDDDDVHKHIKDLIISHLELKALIVDNSAKLIEIKGDVRHHESVIKRHEAIVKIGAWVVGILITFALSHYIFH